MFPRLPLSRAVVRSVGPAVLSLALAAGCSSQEIPVPKGLDGQAIEPIEKRMAAQIEWNKRAAALLPKIVSEKAADKNIDALMALVKEREALYHASRTDKTWEWPDDKKGALEQQFGEDLRNSTTKYLDAAKPFDESGNRRQLVPILIQKYGIDISRMKYVDKTKGI